MVDQQAVILSEMKVRISRLLKVELLAQIDVPLAVVIGKCDGWIHLLEPEPLRPTVRDGCLDIEAVNENSRRVRALWKKFAHPSWPTRSRSAGMCFIFPRARLGTRRCDWGPGITCRTRGC